MPFLKHKNSFSSILTVLGIALLTIGLARGYLDLRASPPSFPLPVNEVGGVMTATPLATPIPPTATATTKNGGGSWSGTDAPAVVYDIVTV